MNTPIGSHKPNSFYITNAMFTLKHFAHTAAMKYYEKHGYQYGWKEVVSCTWKFVPDIMNDKAIMIPMTPINVESQVMEFE